MQTIFIFFCANFIKLKQKNEPGTAEGNVMTTQNHATSPTSANTVESSLKGYATHSLKQLQLLLYINKTMDADAIKA